jgi:hypothetical protein
VAVPKSQEELEGDLVAAVVSFVTVVILQRESVSALLYHPGPPARDIREARPR